MLHYTRKIILGILIFLLLGIFRLVILLFPFRWYDKWLTHTFEREQSCGWRKVQLVENKKFGYARLIGRVVANVSNYTPWQSKCLVQSLVTKFLLRRFNIANTMFVGVGFDEAQEFISHAWVVVNAVIIVGGHDSPQKYKTIKTFEDSH